MKGDNRKKKRQQTSKKISKHENKKKVKRVAEPGIISVIFFLAFSSLSDLDCEQPMVEVSEVLVKRRKMKPKTKTTKKRSFCYTKLSCMLTQRRGI